MILCLINFEIRIQDRLVLISVNVTSQENCKICLKNKKYCNSTRKNVYAFGKNGQGFSRQNISRSDYKRFKLLGSANVLVFPRIIVLN